MFPLLASPPLPLALLLLLASLGPLGGCAYSYREGASTVASSREAAARSVSRAPPVHHGLEVRPAVPEGATVSIPWLELEGRVGTAELFESDVVIALDMSTSANFPSGLDIDEDGVVGELRGVVRAVGSYDAKKVTQGEPPSLPAAQWTTDLDDTVAAMELAAARAIIAGLAQRRNRIGVMTYMERGRVRSEVGSPPAALESLEGLRPSPGITGTDIYRALRTAREMLEETPPLPGFPRKRAVLLFTDGQPTGPVDPFIGKIRAKDAAAELARRGIDLYVFTFGLVGREQAEFVLELAGAGAGRLFPVGAPRRMLDDLPPVDLTPTWLRIENATTEQDGRGVQVDRDGSFGAFVPLEPGGNRIRVLAELGNGRLQRWEGFVVYEPAPDGGGDEAARAARRRVLERIEQREGARDAAAGPPAVAPSGE